MIYNRVNSYPEKYKLDPEFKVAEIIIPGRELQIAWRGISAVMQLAFRHGVDPMDLDSAAIGQSGIEIARNRMFTGVVFRGNVFIVDTISRFFDATGIRGNRDDYVDRLYQPAHDMTYDEYLDYAARPTVYFDALHIDVSPYSNPPTVMPPNAATLNRLTGETLYPEFEAIRLPMADAEAPAAGPEALREA